MRLAEVEVEGLRLSVPESVYPPELDTALMLRRLRGIDLAGRRVLDLCTGSGALAVAAALLGAREVIATDINPACELAVRLNSERYGVRIEFKLGDLFRPVEGERFNLITINPPYLAEEPRDLASAAWAGGPRGRRIIDRFVLEVGGHLRPGGEALLLQAESNGLSETLELAREVGLRAEPVMSEKVAFDRLWVVRITHP